jgi:hypothetical protein
MGDWVAHPSNTAARRILVTYLFLAAMSGEGSPEPKLQVKLGSFVVSLQAKNQFSKPSTKMELVQ